MARGIRALALAAICAGGPAAACRAVADVPEIPLLGYIEGDDPVPHCRAQALGADGAPFELLLPQEGWTGRTIDLYPAGTPGDWPLLAPEALLERGYAVLSAEALRPEMPDLARTLTEAAYGRAPDHRYAAGAGLGGLAALQAATARPGRYDGLYLLAPALGGTRAALQAAQDMQVLAPLGDPARVLTPADLSLVAEAALAACDGLDGAEDGRILDSRGCRTAFDPFALTCAETSLGCLFPERLEALVVMHDGPRDAQFVPLYSDWPWTPALSGEAWRAWRLEGAGFAWAAEVLDLPGPEALRGLDIAGTAQDLPHGAPDAAAVTAFGAEGGRVLIVHGLADPVLSPHRSGTWIETLQQTDPATDSLLRLYAVPGMGHGAAPDLMPALIDWVEEDMPPGALPGPGDGPPLCPWPLFARAFDGQFICAG